MVDLRGRLRQSAPDFGQPRVARSLISDVLRGAALHLSLIGDFSPSAVQTTQSWIAQTLQCAMQ